MSMSLKVEHIQPFNLGESYPDTMSVQTSESHPTTSTQNSENHPNVTAQISKSYPSSTTQGESNSASPHQTSESHPHQSTKTHPVTPFISARPAPITRIFCCDSVAPVSLDSGKSFRDPQGALHNVIFQSYVQYSVRRHLEEEAKDCREKDEERRKMDERRKERDGELAEMLRNMLKGRVQAEMNAGPESEMEGSWRLAFGETDGSHGEISAETSESHQVMSDTEGESRAPIFDGMSGSTSVMFTENSGSYFGGIGLGIGLGIGFGSESNGEIRGSLNPEASIYEETTLPIYIAGQLSENPLNTNTKYVMHLNSRKDFGHVFSHRYFVCPDNLEDNWIELSHIEWFAEGKPFDFRAKEWDLKCGVHNKFFRMTLCLNLDLRTYVPAGLAWPLLPRTISSEGSFLDYVRGLEEMCRNISLGEGGSYSLSGADPA